MLLVSLVLTCNVLVLPTALAGAKIKVGIAYDIGGPGDKSLNDAASAGLIRAKKAFSISAIEVTATAGTPAERETRIRFLLHEGCNPIIVVGYRYAQTLKKIATENPNISFAIINSAQVDLLNVASLVFATNQSAYLAGVAAGLTSKSGKIGYIGALNPLLFDASESGFIAGVKASNTTASVSVKYLQNPSTFAGESDPAEAKAIASSMIALNVDVIYSAADGSAGGTLAAIAGKKVWMIGADSDQYLRVSTSLKKNMLTSTIKHADLALYDFIAAASKGSSVNDVLDAQVGIYGRIYTLAMGGVELSYSGGYLNKYKNKISAAQKAIISGKILLSTQGSS